MKGKSTNKSVKKASGQTDNPDAKEAKQFIYKL